jgi:pimeloyl-ACP methyl ester carboxylesterase
MCHPSKLTQFLTLVLIATLVACSPAATPIPPTSTPIPPTATSLPPTSTPAPTSTIPPKPTPGLIKGKFDAGGVNLNLVCFGTGSPTVVLEAGWCDDWMTWSAILPKMRSHTRVCAYDRAGVGASDSQTGLRTSEQMAEQLHTLLTSANVPGPYLVVGHSIGGMNMLVFADRYPNEVVGVVLIDSPHPDQWKQWSALLPTPAPNEPAGLGDFRKGLVFPSPEDPNYPEPMDWDATLAQVRAVKSLGNIPLAVLVATDPAKRGYGNIPDDLNLTMSDL